MNYVSQDNLDNIVKGMSQKLLLNVANSAVIGDTTPVGTIINFMGTQAPDFYLVCDGQTYNIEDYTELADFIEAQFGAVDYFGGDGIDTFAVPDLQGEFLRMTGTNSHENQGSGANVGVHQDGTGMPYIIGGNNGTIYMSATSYEPSDTDNINTFVNQLTVSGSKTSTIPESFTSRPTNTSVLYCIKYTKAVSESTSLQNYSTEEQRIGTWIDGKPLYQITISEIMPTVATDGTRVTKTIDIDSLNIKFVHNLDGIVNAENTDFNVYNSVNINAFINFTNDIHYFTEAQVIKSSSVTPNYDVLHIGSSIKWTSGQPCYITLQYTKTTD